MKTRRAVSIRLVRLTNLPVAGLLVLLQRTPVVQMAATAGGYVLASPVGAVLRSAAVAAASLGAIDCFAGATSLVAADTSGIVNSPLQATVGTPIPTLAFTISGTATGQTPQSWTVAGTIPPGLNFDGLTAPGDDNDAVTSALTGTPTQAGTYTMDLTGYEFPNTTSGNSPSTMSARFSFTIVVSPATSGGGNPPIYSVTKTAVYSQTQGSGSVADSRWPYVFSAQAQTAVTLGLPGGTTEAVPADAGGGKYQLVQTFRTQAALDSAYPDGTYQMTGAGIPTLSFPLSSDSYPADVPSVTGGANASWSGGVLVIDPARDATINFSNFTTYGTVGAGSYIQFQAVDQLMNGKSLDQLAVSQVNSLGIPQKATPFTSYAIPAGTLNSGDIYKAQLSFNNSLEFDTTTVSGTALLGTFQNYLVFYIITPPSGTPGLPPVIARDITGEGGMIGGSATFAPEVTVGGSPIGGAFQSTWYLNGQPITIDGAKYVGNGTSLTINNLTAADDGVYAASFVNLGGIAFTSDANLQVDVISGEPPVLTILPEGQSMGSGSTLVLTAGATGATSYQWYLNGKRISDSGSGATSNVATDADGPQLVVSKLTSLGAGTYTVVAVNSNGSSPASGPAVVSVASAAHPGSVSGVTVRSVVGGGNKVVVEGFSISGSTSRSVLVQALGPALVPPPYNVGEPLAKPALSIHQTKGGKDVVLYTNSGWGSDPVLLAAAANLGALPRLPAGSSDSELLVTLPPGEYTAQVAGADGTETGVALCAIYQLP
jgi:hypothetical protein